jgi:heptaprenyl diphosphate synthase
MHDRKCSPPHCFEPMVAVQQRVEALLQEVAADADDATGALVAYVSAGKRLRSRLVFTAASVGRFWDDDEVAAFGAFVELIHAGGLCHDDIVDRSARRRSRASLAASHGVRAASVAGLYLMLGAYALVANATPVVRRAIARAAKQVAAGQANEMLDLYRCDVEPETYLERCRTKTGALFELAAELGARAAHLDAIERDAVIGFGAEIGLAFQLADDIRDLQGEAVIGRAPGTDLREGVYTLPVLRTIHGLHEGASELRDLLTRLRRIEDPTSTTAEVRRVLWRNGSIAATAEITANVVRRALGGIDALSGEMRPTFEEFANLAVQGIVRPPARATAA